MPTPTHYSGIAVRDGALAHLVPASRIGARMRPTIARGISGRVGHGAPGNRRGKFHLRRNAIAREPPGASVTDQESAFGSPDDGSGAGDPGPDHEPSNYGSSASRPDSVAAELIAPNHSRHIDRLPGLRGAIFRVHVRRSGPAGPSDARVAECPAGRARPGRRGPPRRARDLE